MKTKILFFTFLFLLSLRTYASHIIGGEISYTCSGSNQYHFTLKVYRDCYNGTVPIDNPAYITVFDPQNNVLNNLSVYWVTDSVLMLASNCGIVTPDSVCAEEGTYVFTVNLPPSSGAYTIVYQRCCRAFDLNNILDPINTGMTIYCTVENSDVALCNTSPKFINYPPVLFCAGVPISFDHSATEPDGDSIVYELCAVDSGASALLPFPMSASPPPYSSVNYQSPYTALYPITSSPSLSIDANSGLMAGTPTAVGYYAVAVCVKEYRNGILISQTRRDLPVYTLAYSLNSGFNMEQNSIRIFPNPSAGSLSVLFPTVSGNEKITVSDVFGREVFHTELRGNQFSEVIDLSTLPEGNYQATVISDFATSSGKLILMH